MGGRGYRARLRPSPHRSPRDRPPTVFCAPCDVPPATPARTGTDESYAADLPERPSAPPSRSVPRLSGEEPIHAAVTQELDHAWARIAAGLRRNVTDSTYAIWLDPLLPVGLDGGMLTVS